MRVPELLSPAGDWECLRAAVANGADAVYFGLTQFNARLRAQNFTESDLPEVVDYLHSYGKRGFVTLNTLIFTDEIESAARQIDLIAMAGADAMIVQDPALALLARRIAPELAVHASTQMTITSPECLEVFRDLGIKRVVLARELSLKEIAEFGAVGLPIEVFVHGALCVAYSGQCLTSESLGQRSANRGECAQACRMPYQLVVDGKLLPMRERQYLLSPQDLAGIDHVAELVRLGVTSLKIEGRLKSPEYVAAVTAAYRKAIDRAVDQNAETLSDQDRYALEMTFSRGLYPGWLDGVNHQELVKGTFGKKRGAFVGHVDRVSFSSVTVEQRIIVQPGDGVVFANPDDTEHEEGGRVYQVTGKVLQFRNGQIDFRRVKRGTEVWKTDDPALNKRLRRSFRSLQKPRDKSVCMEISGRIGAPLRLAIKFAGLTVTAYSNQILQAPRSAPLSRTKLWAELKKLGDTGFRLENLELDLEPIFLPISEVVDTRRRAMQELQALAARPDRNVAITGRHLPADLLTPVASSLPEKPELIVLCRTLEQLDSALELGVNSLYVDFEDPRRYKEAVALAAGQADLFLATPRILKPRETGVLRLIANCAPTGILIRNWGALPFFRGLRMRLRGDFSLNVTNPITAQYLIDQGLESLTISYDLDVSQIVSLMRYQPAPNFELTLHQHMPMFHMEHCVFAAFLSDGKDYRDCGRPCDRHRLGLQDRVGQQHPVTADVGCRNTVFNGRAQSGAKYLSQLTSAGINRFRLELLLEDRQRAAQIIQLYLRMLADQCVFSESTLRSINAHSQIGVIHGASN